MIAVSCHNRSLSFLILQKQLHDILTLALHISSQMLRALSKHGPEHCSAQIITHRLIENVENLAVEEGNLFLLDTQCQLGFSKERAKHHLIYNI